MEFCWLSCGRALTRFFELQEKVKALLQKHDYNLPKEMESQEFNQMLVYLSEIVTHMNDLSISMQGKNINILKCHKKLNVFKEKLHLWCLQFKKGNLLNFFSLEEMVDDSESLIPMCVKKL